MALMKKNRKSDAGIPTSSMADIAFLLLIFFLVTTTFDEEKGLEIVLPEQGSEVAVSQKNVMHLLVQPDGLVQVKRGESVQLQTLRSSEIASVWRQAATTSDNPANLIAAVKTSPAAPYRYMIDVLDQLRLAGADKISLQLLGED